MHYVRNSAGGVMAIKIVNKSAKKKESSPIKIKETKKSSGKSKKI